MRSKDEQDLCPIVGIGGSAGGFEAAMELLRELSPKSGMAFAVVQHLDPHHASKLASLLGRATSMPVIEVEKTIEIEPNTVRRRRSHSRRYRMKEGSTPAVAKILAKKSFPSHRHRLACDKLEV